MCMGGSPNIPAPAPPQQAVRQPEVQGLRDRSRMSRSSAAMGGGSLLTGAAGVSPALVSTGKTSLLGG